MDKRCEFKSQKVKCFFGDWEAGYRENFEIFVIGMGSGQGCDVQYLFSEDILGYNKGHIPRHSKVYTNLSEDFEKIKIKSIDAYKSFKSDIDSNIYPGQEHDIAIDEIEFQNFLKQFHK